MIYVECAAVGISLLAAFLMTLGNPSKVWISMALWAVGSILWFMVGYDKDVMGLMVVNVFFFIIEVYGLYKWFKIKDK